jgi:hypothetical protein
MTLTLVTGLGVTCTALVLLPTSAVLAKKGLTERKKQPKNRPYKILILIEISGSVTYRDNYQQVEKGLQKCPP